MLWTIVFWVGIVLGLLLAAGVVFFIYVMVTSARKDRRVRKEGRALLTALVMANTELQDPDGAASVPGLVVFGFYEASRKTAGVLLEIAERVYELYESEDLDSLKPEVRQFAMKLKDHNYHEDRRHQVPMEISGSLTIYAADLVVYRDRIPPNSGSREMLACAVTGQQQGEIAQLPNDDPAVSQIYAAAGVA